MIKRKWKSKDKILLMFLIGQVSCIVSFCKPLSPLFNDIKHYFSHIHCHYSCYCFWYFDVEYYFAPHPLCPLLRLHVQHNYALIQQLYLCPKVGFDKPTFRFAADYFVFCYSLFFAWSCQSIAVFFVVWHHDKNNLTPRLWDERSKLPR